ncbi:histidine kinase [Intrasporangium oryzae NRRL B-24470]|uniref:Histidine kinase n=1 Tax=Intrasporangium oryzae NRRL B-24470 TaxID=1386089 RepID=W9GDF8_9MICO|nr:DUF4118 domain-containing protein [Intrasporangium oryzae]EWT03252.1 histidine kinase [Intrasporangium oryzae NRRL B-24470]
MTTEWLTLHRGAVRWAAALVPLALAGLLALFRDSMSQSTQAMLLVLPVVAAAATGDRVAGVISALAAAGGFDFFLTVPYLSLSIHQRDDLVLAVALVVVGLAVTELALWGHRAQAAAQRRDGYLAGMLELLAIAPDSEGRALPRAVAKSMTSLLDVDRCEWVEGTPSPDDAVVDSQGRVTVRGHDLRVGVVGLPTDSWTAVPVDEAGRTVGYFRVAAASRVVRPTPDQLRAAVLLAGQVLRAGPSGGGRSRSSPGPSSPQQG